MKALLHLFSCAIMLLTALHMQAQPNAPQMQQPSLSVQGHGDSLTEDTLTFRGLRTKDASFSRDGRFIVYADADLITVWDIATGSEVSIPGRAPISLRPDGEQLAGVGQGGILVSEAHRHGR